MIVSSEVEDSVDSIPPARALRSMQTGQNSIAPEISVPQIEQVRLGSVLMNLTVLRIRANYRLDRMHGVPGTPTISGESMFRNKISETLEAGCLYNGMKSLISDHDYELHLVALRNQAFRRGDRQEAKLDRTAG